MLVNIIIFFIGSVFGSFFNVCIHRLPKGESIILPASHCVRCNRPLRIIDNIPILSYILLKGRCHFCQIKIPLRYPLVELLTGAAFLFIFIENGFGVDFFFLCLFVGLFIIGFFTDLEEQIIPDEIVLIGLPGGIIYRALEGSVMDSIIAAAAGYSVFFLIEKVGKFYYKKDVIGYGDLKLAAMLGAILGLAGFFQTFFLAYIIGAIISILLLLARIKKMGDFIPFGPFLILAALITLFIGPRLILAVF